MLKVYLFDAPRQFDDDLQCGILQYGLAPGHDTYQKEVFLAFNSCLTE